MTDAPAGPETRLFIQALGLPDAEREAFLRQGCADPQVAEMVLAQVRQWDPDFRPAPVELPTGTLIANRYRVLDRVSGGGMGEVFLARDERLRKHVALKRLLISLTAKDRERLWIEAVIQAQITHPHVAATYDIVDHGEDAFIVMEYVEGESLATCLKRGRLPRERVFAIGRQLASALSAAHAKGIIHRDVKPGNVQVTPDGSVKLLDFGIAAVTHAFTTMTLNGAKANVLGPQPGTPGYMSPEQAEGRSVDERSDIFSLGLVLFEMATGERAYLARDVRSLAMTSREPVRAASTVDRNLPRALTDVISRAVQIDPSLRFQTASQLEAALEDAANEAVKPQPFLDALRAVFGSLRGSPAGFVMAGMAGLVALVAGVTGLGFLNSTAFNVMLERTDFAGESWRDWLRWGFKSCVMPFAMVAFALMALVLIAVLRNLSAALSPRAGALEKRLRGALAALSRRMRLDDVAILSSWLLLASGAALIGAWWLFSPYFTVIFTHVSTARAKDLALLSATSLNGRLLFRQTFNAIFVFSAISWYQVARLAMRNRGSVSRALVGGGFVIVTLSLLSFQIPYRLFFHAEFYPIDWNHEACYVMGDRSSLLLLLCPTAKTRVLSVPKPENWTPTKLENVF